MFPDITLAEFAIVSAVVMAGAASQAAIGMGLNLLAIPLLVLIDPVYAPGPVLLASLVNSLLALARVPVEIDRREIGFALIGLAVGTVLAGAVLLVADGPSLARLLGLMVLVGVGLALSGWSAALTMRNLLIAGGGAGFLGTIAGVHAPPMALLYQRMEPARMRGAILSFIALGNALSIGALVLVGRFGVLQLGAAVYLVPGVLLGIWAAPALVRAMAPEVLRVLVLGISAVSGLMLVIGA